MKNFLLVPFFTIFLCSFAAGQDAPLEQYIGKYVFPEGSAVPWVEVKLTEGGLITESPMGNATLQRIEKDLFSIVEYNGTSEFRRNGDGKVTGIKVAVMGLEMEGTKEQTSLLPYLTWLSLRNGFLVF